MFRLTSLLSVFLLSSVAICQDSVTSSGPVRGRFVVVYRDRIIPENAERDLASRGAQVVSRMNRFGTIAVSGSDDVTTKAALLTQLNVAMVLQDRYVTAHRLLLAKPQRAVQDVPRVRRNPISDWPIFPVPPAPGHTSGAFYDSPQGWAVRQSGGFGDSVPGGNPTGPWNAARGAGIRIAVLDSGVDASNPSVASNLALSLTEVDQKALPSVCDDGSPQDQQGHGTWTASLAAGAIGSGEVIGVAPQATLLNIKVLQRLPGTGTTAAAQCEAGEAGGLLSWVLKGIDDAISQHAEVITLSLGTLVDISTGEGAGWKAAFDQATYAATQAGAVVIAAVGNDGLNLSVGTLVELPAQARSVLAVVASTNPGCEENLAEGAVCVAGPVTRPAYSNYGRTLNAIAAPGGSYPEGTNTGVSGFVRGACSSGLPNTADGLPGAGDSFGCFGFGHQPYVQAIGTSASAPLVAGAAAVLRAANPAWTPAQIVAALLATGSVSASMPELQVDLPAALAFQPAP